MTTFVFVHLGTSALYQPIVLICSVHKLTHRAMRSHREALVDGSPRLPGEV